MVTTGLPLHLYAGSPERTLNRCRVALPLTITHGRSGIGNQPDAPSCSFTWWQNVCPINLGERLRVTAEVNVAPAVYDSGVVMYDDAAAVYDSDGTDWVERTRFVGSVAAIRAREEGGEVVDWAIEAVGVQAALGFQRITGTLPAASDSDRITAIAALAGISVEVRGTANLMLAADTIDGDPLEALQNVCKSSGGLLWQTPDGRLVYGSADHRQLADTAGALPCDAVRDGLDWDSSVDDILNSVTIKWAGGESVHEVAESIAESWGVRATSVDTICNDEADAEILGALILARRAWPFWSTPTALVPGDRVTEDLRPVLAALDVSTPVWVPWEADPGPTPANNLAPAIVEGWVETWDTTYGLQVALSDAHRWVATSTRTYTEVLAGGTYRDWLPIGTYLDMLVQEG
jgi:hypothetical protein